MRPFLICWMVTGRPTAGVSGGAQGAGESAVNCAPWSVLKMAGSLASQEI